MASIGSYFNAHDSKMTRPFRLVAVSGGLQRPSRSAALAEHLLDLIAEAVPCQPRLVELGQLAPQLAGAVWRSQLPDAVERELATVEQADALVIDHQLRPLFRFFQARTLPLVGLTRHASPSLSEDVALA